MREKIRSSRQELGASFDGGARAQTWRSFVVNVHPDLLSDVPELSKKNDIPVDKLYLSPPVLQALYSRLRIKQDADKLLDVRVIQRSLDARKTRRPGEEPGPRFTYVIDVDVADHVAQELRFRQQPGRMELLSSEMKSQNESALTDEKLQDDVSQDAKPPSL